jgi:hypothetical protein
VQGSLMVILNTQRPRAVIAPHKSVSTHQDHEIAPKLRRTVV